MIQGLVIIDIALPKTGLDDRDIGISFSPRDNDFEETFTKDLEIEQDDVPAVLFELHENSLLYMDREEWERALILLQKAQILIEQVNIENYK